VNSTVIAIIIGFTYMGHDYVSVALWSLWLKLKNQSQKV